MCVLVAFFMDNVAFIINPSAINEKFKVSGTSLFFRSVIDPRISDNSIIICCIITE